MQGSGQRYSLCGPGTSTSAVRCLLLSAYLVKRTGRKSDFRQAFPAASGWLLRSF